MDEKKKLLVVCGPTAIGKTEIGILLAKKKFGEIVSADSRQVYRGMDIITGKDLNPNGKFISLKSEQISKFKIKNGHLNIGYRIKKRIPIWLVDIVNPDYTFNVGEYYKAAKLVIEDILQRGKLPIIIGGSGLYIRSIIRPLHNIEIPPNYALRQKLNGYSLQELQKELHKVDKRTLENMNASDRKNPRRLIRYIELGYTLDKDKKIQKNILYPYNTFLIGLTSSWDFLYKKIDERVDRRVQKGAIKEIENLLQKGYSFENASFTASGYKFFQTYFMKKQKSSHLQRNYLLQDAVQKWKKAEHRYAKRQSTWFKKEKGIVWFDVNNTNWIQKIEKAVERWYTP